MRDAPKPIDQPLASQAELSDLLRGLPGEVVARIHEHHRVLQRRVQSRLDEQAKAVHQAREDLGLTREELDHANHRIQYLLEQMVLARRRLFGANTEHGQGLLFDEAEQLAEANDEPPAPRAGVSRRGKRQALAPALPRVAVVHELGEADRRCPCGCVMQRIGEQVSEQLDIVPMQVRVLRHVRHRYGCVNKAHPPIVAPLPAQPLPKSNASAGTLAMLYTAKYVDGMPLARLSKALARHGATVPRQTLARWAIEGSAVLQPILNLLRDQVFDYPLVHMDETTVQVLKESGRAAQSKSYMWVQTGGPPDKPVVLYDYEASRSGQVPRQLLAGYRGWLMTDGYEGYNALVDSEAIEHQVCMVHARRKFVEAKAAQPKGKHGKADRVLKLMARLYRIERELKALGDGQRFLGRRERSVPVLKALRELLDSYLVTVTPRSALGKAVAYLARYWAKLIRFTEWGYLPIDNNRAENAIRPFVIGRKAWLFADTPGGARASSMIYSLVESARANGVEPYSWLKLLLQRLPAATSVEQIEALLPWNIHQTTLVDTASA